jgi:hypothetical protein
MNIFFAVSHAALRRIFAGAFGLALAFATADANAGLKLVRELGPDAVLLYDDVLSVHVVGVRDVTATASQGWRLYNATDRGFDHYLAHFFPNGRNAIYADAVGAFNIAVKNRTLVIDAPSGAGVAAAEMAARSARVIGMDLWIPDQTLANRVPGLSLYEGDYLTGLRLVQEAGEQVGVLFSFQGPASYSTIPLGRGSLQGLGEGAGDPGPLRDLLEAVEPTLAPEGRVIVGPVDLAIARDAIPSGMVEVAAGPWANTGPSGYLELQDAAEGTISIGLNESSRKARLLRLGMKLPLVGAVVFAGGYGSQAYAGTPINRREFTTDAVRVFNEPFDWFMTAAELPGALIRRRKNQVFGDHVDPAPPPYRARSAAEVAMRIAMDAEVEANPDNADWLAAVRRDRMLSAMRASSAQVAALRASRPAWVRFFSFFDGQ